MAELIGASSLLKGITRDLEFLRGRPPLSRIIEGYARFSSKRGV
ncbi:MAG: hypothetical protein WA364_03555 [Candidatus Nitrosopolaris sp.]